jgi:hypothetical protein
MLQSDWLGVRDDFRNWLAWACGPRNAMKIGLRKNSARGSGEIESSQWSQ